ncbi:hypothetical protein B0T22DRAFT_473202 [Podospora appendiculata]|uniref:Uncharacterized protein n=1 Tax=Podospora appendiculata TaxID=314037 RepID=A0AAE0WZD1_9PEZI|nr:hypothetical protein B0T22DRAFT_473202 [Podospora appendiculata]
MTMNESPYVRQVGTRRGILLAFVLLIHPYTVAGRRMDLNKLRGRESLCGDGIPLDQETRSLGLRRRVQWFTLLCGCVCCVVRSFVPSPAQRNQSCSSPSSVATDGKGVVVWCAACVMPRLLSAVACSS